MYEYWDVYNSDGKIIQGKSSVRGRHDLGSTEYHLVVYIWIINDKNQFIVSRRQKGRTYEGFWECTGGCALRGDSSLTAALREVREELGLKLDRKNGELYKRYLRNYPEGAKAICDVWVFRQNFDISEFDLQVEEVSEAKIVTVDELRAMSKKNDFSRRYPYINELIYKYCK